MTGALIERHDLLADELAWRKAEKHGFPEDEYLALKASHNSPMESFRKELAELDPLDTTYGNFSDIVAANPDRVITDLRHLFEKWDMDNSKGRPPKDHDPEGAYEQLIELVGDPEEVDKLLEVKLLT